MSGEMDERSTNVGLYARAFRVREVSQELCLL
jgi:hypothetical protein